MKSKSQAKPKNVARKKTAPKKKDEQAAETDAETASQLAVGKFFACWTTIRRNSQAPSPDVPPKKKYRRLYEDVSDDFSSPPSPKHKRAHL